MQDPSETVTFQAAIARVQTLADLGLRVTLDLPETAVMEAGLLMAIRGSGVTVRVTVEPIERRNNTT